MKINQLFVKHVDLEVLLPLVECFGLSGLADRRMFCKADMARMGTAQRVLELVPVLREFYLPCKARIYLSNLTEKKCITVLKQVLKLHGHVLLSRERNSRHKKVILYQIISDQERQAVTHIEVRHDVVVDLVFD